MLLAKKLFTRVRSKLNYRKRNVPPLSLSPIHSREEYRNHKQTSLSEYRRRDEIENRLAGSINGFFTPGYCFVCNLDVEFYTDFSYSFTDSEGNQKPNWREHMLCPSCGLNNRMRAAIQIFEQVCQPHADNTIYLTEQITPLFSWFARNYRNVVGSEYLADKIPFGQMDERGLRNETLTDLTLLDNQVNFILSFDVCEHIPDYKTAFRECLRCLAPGGTLLFTVPFSRDSDKHIVRARMSAAGEIEHILPPEYHGDPLNTSGTLCFYHFGWDLLRELRSMGFESAIAYLYWSHELGYLGHEQIVFLARKGQSPTVESSSEQR